MVQIVENHAEIHGTLLSREDDPESPGFVRLLVMVEGAAAVPPWPNMFERHVGEPLLLHARPDEVPESVSDGHQVRLRVRMAGPDLAMVEK